MRIVEPEVYLLAQTTMCPVEQLLKPFKGNLQTYLAMIGADTWQTTPCTDGEMLVEVAGRLCYKAFGLGLNKNVTRVREGNDVYIGNLIDQDHGSVMEHSTVTFLFNNVSRILTHELVRHRVGVAISQESGRYCRMDDIAMYIPECFRGDREVMQLARDIVQSAEYFAKRVSEKYALDAPGTAFKRKKEVTSAIRRWAPAGHTTSLVWTTNHRNLRFVLQKRTEGGAEEEIQKLFDPIGYGMTALFPNMYQDFYRRSSGEWVSRKSKAGVRDRILDEMSKAKQLANAGNPHAALDYLLTALAEDVK